MSFEERIQRAEEARQLMTNPLLADAFISIEERAVQAWKNSLPHDPAARESAWRSYVAISSLRGELQSYIDDGKWAEADQRNRKIS
jgi:hypothetical protein